MSTAPGPAATAAASPLPLAPRPLDGPLPILDELPPESAMPPPHPAVTRPRASAALMVVAVLAVAYTLWAAQDIVLPVLLAMFLALVGNPIIRFLRKLWIPRFLGALIVLLGGLAAAGYLGAQLVDPATAWISQAPQQMQSVSRQLRNVVKPMHDANLAAENIARAAGGETSRRVQVVRTQMDDPYASLIRTPKLVLSMLAVVLLTFFFMVYGANLQRHAIALLPGRQKKKFTVDIMHAIERELSRYVLTISIINTCVGLIYAGILMLLGIGMQEALLWGTAVALLNFAPYVGPLIGMGMMLLMGFINFTEPLQAVLPAALYLLLHGLEGQFVTPIILGRRMALSPLMLILALMVFGWLWGLVGLLLAVPLLVCIKLVLARVEGMDGWARLLE